jgi:hypothetical protein
MKTPSKYTYPGNKSVLGSDPPWLLYIPRTEYAQLLSSSLQHMRSQVPLFHLVVRVGKPVVLCRLIRYGPSSALILRMEHIPFKTQ